MANEYVFEDEHFTPKFSAGFVYRGLEEVWVGDGDSETREDYNDYGYLYAKYQDGRIVCIGQTAPESAKSIEAAKKAAQDAENSATLAESYKSVAEQKAQIATNEASRSTTGADSATRNANQATQERYKSEGYACGTQDGVDADSSSPYYHNNAKYYYDMITQSGGIPITIHDLYEYFNWDSYLLEAPMSRQIVVYVVGPFLFGFVDLKMRDDVQGEVSDTVQFYSNYHDLFNIDTNRSVTIPIIAWTDSTIARQQIGVATFTFEQSGSVIDLSISREALPDGYSGTVSAYIRGFFVLPLRIAFS